MPTPQQPLGLDLTALANQGIAETDTRLAGGKSLMDAYLAQVIRDNIAGNTSAAERQRRQDEFNRSQSVMSDELGRRSLDQEGNLAQSRMAFENEQAGLQRAFLADEANRQRAFELGQAAAGRQDFGEQERVRTNEAIRQARAVARIQAEEQARASMPSVADFGNEAVDPYRGQALAQENRYGYYTTAFADDDLDRVRSIIQHNAQNPAEVARRAREVFADQGQMADERASIALWQLGYLPG